MRTVTGCFGFDRKKVLRRNYEGGVERQYRSTKRGLGENFVYSGKALPTIGRFMLDPKLLRESPDVVRAAIAKKHLSVDLDAVLELDQAWRTALQEVEVLRSRQKAANLE